MSTAKFAIYRDIVCIESYSPYGHLWWDQGYNLGFTPLPIQHVTHVKHGKLTEGGRQVIAIRFIHDNVGKWVAINLPRSDLAALARIFPWPKSMQKPYTEIEFYTPPPTPL